MSSAVDVALLIDGERGVRRPNRKKLPALLVCDPVSGLYDIADSADVDTSDTADPLL